MVKPRPEAKLIKEIVSFVASELVRTSSDDDEKGLVGIEPHGTQAVTGIMLNKSKQRITHLDGKSFSSMRNLKLLKISNVDLSENLQYLSNELRFLKWPEYPSNYLPLNFQPPNLFELNLCHSRIKYLWKGVKLKTIKLSCSHYLIETPDFTRVPYLEVLDFEGCTRLRKVHDSVGYLERLTILNLKNWQPPKSWTLVTAVAHWSMTCGFSIMRNNYSFCFENPGFTTLESEHLWLAYVSRVNFEYDYSDPISYGDSINCVPINGSTCIHAWFGIDGVENSNWKVIKCGIRLVYKQDIEFLPKHQLLPRIAEGKISVTVADAVEFDEIPEAKFIETIVNNVSNKLMQDWKYDVFLSFRGIDTGNKFTDHLYAALDAKEIKTFRDDNKKETPMEVFLEAIEVSRLSIIVLSKNYVSSTRCLDELEKIVECIEKKNQTVLPIFYYIDPSEARKQKGDFKKAFDKHEEELINKEKVARWRKDLRKVGSLSGWHLLLGRSEAKFIKDVVDEISRKLRRTKGKRGDNIQWKYDVFLNFRGEDTRNNFTDHLYVALDQKRFITFIDDERLERGRAISSDLLEAIERSRLSIVIFSKKYAYSTWCLDELVKIVECMEMRKQYVVPVFHYIDQTFVQEQKGEDFENAFDEYEKASSDDDDLEKVQKWREALTKVASIIPGWPLQDRASRFLSILFSFIAIFFSLSFLSFSMANPNNHITISNDKDTTKPLLAINISSQQNIKLNYTNYLSWKLQFHAMLVGYNLDGSHPAPAATVTINNQIKDQLKRTSKGSRRISEYIEFIKSQADELAVLGKPLDDEDLIENILDGLDDDYQPLVDEINGHDTMISFDELHEKLITKKLMLNQFRSSSASLPTTTNPAAPLIRPWRSSYSSPTSSVAGPPSLSSYGPRPPFKPYLDFCQACNTQGHTAKRCPSFNLVASQF
ncbi:hypothetical protein JRO89_XS07G0285400 [Xanthoceras sorbifolium]|uniref:TIR domain-containing protein n=1 Tax=Xanthoceras sorbifolium TaxID=99658 RepID=A0ABQ8HVV4_9ROSI|nr:hypothetical protein JRO89_XS07G0285400 [Xanthoceras sorbifolium]